jgi:polyisoprenyl-phosphate glycosyltransferase
VSVELSVVVPIYNEQESVPELITRLHEALAGVVRSYEVILVDDGSSDRTWEIIGAAAARDARIKGLSFSRNFGHQMAFAAGLRHTVGDAVVIMDADLQDPPELIPQLLARWRDGFDVVYAVRTKREGETIFKRVSAATFYRVLRAITQVDIPVDTGDFRLMSRKAVDAFNALEERHRFTRGLVTWLGFRQVGVPYQRAARHAGESKYPLRKMWRLATDGITSFSSLPLHLAGWFGGVVSALGFVGFVAALLARVAGRGIPLTALLVLALVFLGGVQLVCLGFLGAYLGRVHEEAKRRPLYLVQEAVGLGEAQGAATTRA